ncbi:MAG: hypothetical protein ABW184_00325 [Sphingobium sp.]
MTSLTRAVARVLDADVHPDVVEAAHLLCARIGGDAVLFYGSILRTGDLSGVLDFYVLRGDGTPRPGVVRRLLWPDVSYHEFVVAGQTLRAKVAAMPLATFERAAAGETIDTTIWARFAQPARLVIAPDPAVRERVVAAVAACLTTAARFAAVLGPERGEALDYWRHLFSQTYRTELRLEKVGRGDSIVASDPGYFSAMLVAAWRALGWIGDDEQVVLTPRVPAAERKLWRSRWRRSTRAGKPLNVARLVKAAWTFEGASRYALWKIERHTGVHVALTPWRERHPVLAAPGILYKVWTAR